MTEKLKLHCSTTDFTINSMAMDENGKIYDYFGGQEDLKNKILRFVGNPDKRIMEDPLRILRGLRFASRFNLTFEENSYNAIKRNFYLLKELPIERITEEFKKILKLGDISKLLEFPFFEYFIPELPMMKNYGGGKHHNESPYDHCVSAYYNSFKHNKNYLRSLAALLHDIGKSLCIKVSEDGKKVTFYNHDYAGAHIAKNIMKRMKFSSKEIQQVYVIIKYHMFGYFGTIKPVRYLRVYREFTEAGLNIMDLVEQQSYDYYANMKNEDLSYHKYLEINELYKYIQEHLLYPHFVKELKIGALTLRDEYGYQGKDISIMLEAILNLIWEDKLKNKNEDIVKYLNRRKERTKVMIKNDTHTKR